MKNLDKLVGKLVDNEINFAVDCLFPYSVGFERGTLALEEVTPGRAVFLAQCDCDGYGEWRFDLGQRSLHYTAREVSRPWWKKLFCKERGRADFSELFREFNDSPKKQIHSESTLDSCKLVLTWGAT